MTDQLKLKLQFIVDRIERLEEERRALLAAKRAIYTEAKNANLIPKALRGIIAERRQKDWAQIEAAKHEYRVALGMAVNDVANGASLREAAATHGISKSTIHDAVRRAEKSEIGQPTSQVATPVTKQDEDGCLVHTG
jgi:uncharacterized protein (UPF0335 family)